MQSDAPTEGKPHCVYPWQSSISTQAFCSKLLENNRSGGKKEPIEIVRKKKKRERQKQHSAIA